MGTISKPMHLTVTNSKPIEPQKPDASLLGKPNPPVIIGGRTMLPIIFVAESFGYAVDWDGSTETVTIHPQN